MGYKLKFEVVKEPNNYFLARSDARGDGVNFKNLKEVFDYILTCQSFNSIKYPISINLSRNGFSVNEYQKLSALTRELTDVANEILTETKKKSVLERIIELSK